LLNIFKSIKYHKKGKGRAGKEKRGILLLDGEGKALEETKAKVEKGRVFLRL
jgi:hypothetical protein